MTWQRQLTLLDLPPQLACKHVSWKGFLILLQTFRRSQHGMGNKTIVITNGKICRLPDTDLGRNDEHTDTIDVDGISRRYTLLKCAGTTCIISSHALFLLITFAEYRIEKWIAEQSLRGAALQCSTVYLLWLQCCGEIMLWCDLMVNRQMYEGARE